MGTNRDGYYDCGCYSDYSLYGYWNFPDWKDYGNANWFTFVRNNNPNELVPTYDIRL